MSNGFLDSPSFRKITPPSQRERVERRRSSSGRTGSGSRDDPVRRETSEEAQARQEEQKTDFQDNLRRIQQEFSRTGDRISQSEAEAILRGETPQSIVDRANKSIRSTPAQRFVETGEQRIAVSDAFASKVDESIGRGDFERIAREQERKRLESIAAKSPELTVISTAKGSQLVTRTGEPVAGMSLTEFDSFDEPRTRLVTPTGRDVTPLETTTIGGLVSEAPRQTRAGRFISALGTGFTRPDIASQELMLDRVRAPERAGLAIGFAGGAATAAIGGLAGQTASQGIPLVSRIAGFTGETVGTIQGFGRQLAGRLGIGATSRQVIGIVSRPVGAAALLAPAAIDSTARITTGTSTLSKELVRQAPPLVASGVIGTSIVRNVAFGKGRAAGIQRGVVAGVRFNQATRIPTFKGSTFEPISPASTQELLTARTFVPNIAGRDFDRITVASDRVSQIIRVRRGILTKEPIFTTRFDLGGQAIPDTNLFQTRLVFGRQDASRIIRDTTAQQRPPVVWEEISGLGSRDFLVSSKKPVFVNVRNLREQPEIETLSIAQLERLPFLQEGFRRALPAQQQLNIASLSRGAAKSRSLLDFDLSLRTSERRTRFNLQPPSTISTSQLLPEKEVFVFREGRFVKKIVGGDIGKGVPRFSLQSGKRPTATELLNMPDNIIDSRLIKTTQASIPQSTGATKKTTTIFFDPTGGVATSIGKFAQKTQFPPITSLRLPPRQARLSSRKPSTTPSTRARESISFVPILGSGLASSLVSEQRRSLGSRGGQDVVSDLGLGSRGAFRFNINQELGITQKQAQRISTDQDLDTVLVTSFVPKTTDPFIPRRGGSPPPPPPPPPPLIPLPTLDLPKDSLFGQKTKSSKRKDRGFQFTPSISGATFKIKETGSKATTGFTGLEIRGI